MKLFNWFKKKVNLVSTPPTTNINGIYSARLEDLDTIRNSLGSLQTQLQELSNRLDSLPPIPDHSQFARKDQENVFLAQQEIKTTAPYLSFKKQNNQRKGYIGTASSSSNDIELRAETNSLNMIANHNISLQAGSNYNITVNKDPTTNESVANKRYVDTQIANIPSVNLDNVAKLNGENTFTNVNTFSGGAIFSSIVRANNIEMTEQGNQPNSVATVKYVLDNVFKPTYAENDFRNLNATVIKKDMNYGIYWYKGNLNINVPIGKTGKFLITLSNIWLKKNNIIVTVPGYITFVAILPQGTQLITPELSVLSTVDLTPGSAGTIQLSECSCNIQLVFLGN